MLCDISSAFVAGRPSTFVSKCWEILFSARLSFVLWFLSPFCWLGQKQGDDVDKNKMWGTFCLLKTTASPLIDFFLFCCCCCDRTDKSIAIETCVYWLTQLSYITSICQPAYMFFLSFYIEAMSTYSNFLKTFSHQKRQKPKKSVVVHPPENKFESKVFLISSPFVSSVKNIQSLQDFNTHQNYV